MTLKPFPNMIVHVDWSAHPSKRWMARAFLDSSNRYCVRAPEPVGDVSTFLYRIKEQSGADALILLGFDFPIGLPYTYAKLISVTNFLSLLPQLGKGAWANFYLVAETYDQINLYRPFYPNKPGGKSIEELTKQLNMERVDNLRRQCELAHPGRRAASPLFWTLGPQQVGKAALNGWKYVLTPGLLDVSLNVTIWPFAGNLVDLLQPGRIVIVETYPAEYIAHLLPDLKRRRFSKRSHRDRMTISTPLLDWARNTEVILHPFLEKQIKNGFSEEANGEDLFDTVIGLFGMLNLIIGKRTFYEPLNPIIKHIEGWIFGQAL